MQNRENELPKHVSNGNEHTSGGDSSAPSFQTGSMEHDLHQVAVSADQDGQTLHNRHTTDSLLRDQDNAVHNNHNELKSFCYDFKKTAKLNPDDMVDDIVLSEDEAIQLDENRYNKEMNMVNNLYNDEEADSMNKYTGTRNEVEERKEIPVTFVPDPEALLLEAGIVEDIIENDKIIIRANTERGILDLDNIIFNSNKIAVGYLDDVIGKVDNPNYVIIFFPNIGDTEKASLVSVNQPLFYVDNRTKLLDAYTLINKKGCDASNAFDEEISADDMEYSDDEEERSRKKKNKNKRQKTDDGHVKVSADNLMKKYSNQGNNYKTDNYGISQTKPVVQNKKQYQNDYPMPNNYAPKEGNYHMNNLPQMNNPYFNNPYTFGANPQMNMYGMNQANSQFSFGFGNQMPQFGNIGMNMSHMFNPNMMNMNNNFNQMQQPGVGSSNQHNTNFNMFSQQINPFVRPDNNNQNNNK